MFKYLRVGLTLGLYCILRLPKIWYYSYKKDKIPLEKRFGYGRKYMRKLSKAFRVSYHFINLEHALNKDKIVLIPNHQSFFDPMLFSEIYDKPFTVIAKAESRKFFIVGDIENMIDALFMQRDDLRQSIKIMKEAKRRILEENQPVIIFPEGTRSNLENGDLLEYKPGSFKIAYDTQSVIVPVVISGTRKMLDIKCKQKKYDVTVKFMDPIPYETYEKMTTIELSEHVRNLTMKELKIMIQEK